MPKQIINYDRCYFYKIVCKSLEIQDCYVGHTTDFTTRKCSHKNRCINPSNSKHHYKVYEFIRNHGGWENWNMVLIEECKCDNALEAGKKERFYIEGLKANLNQIIPTRTYTEWQQQNPDKRKAICFRYNEKNRDDINQKCNEYYHKNRDKKLEKLTCPCGGVYCRVACARHLKTQMHIAYMKSLDVLN